jgi:hypothetical protein
MNHERSCLLIFVTARIITPTNRVYTDEADAPATPAPEGQIPPAETLNRWLGDPQPAR